MSVGGCGIGSDVPNFPNDTIINSGSTADYSGTITQWCVYANNPCNGRLKVFRDDGTNYLFIGESSLESIIQGSNTFSTNISGVQVGDLIGVYSDGATIYYEASVALYYKSGDISSDSLKSSWTGLSNLRPKIGIQFGLSDVYVNSSTGSDSNVGDSCASGHPVLTFEKAYSLCKPDGTSVIHVCNSGADFSGETVTLNKSFDITVDGSGNFYMPKAS